MSSASLRDGLDYNKIGIRYKLEDRLISLTDLWVAHSKPSNLRLDRWVKLEQSQELLEKIGLQLKVAPKKDENGFIESLAKAYEVIRGGNKLFQGVFAAPDVALAYAKCLSDECYKWLQSVLEEKSTILPDNKPDNKHDNKLQLPINVEDFGGKVRFTPDGRISVYDGIAFSIAQKNPYQVWNRLTVSHPEVLTKCEDFKFPGKGQRETPVANLQVFLEILVILPGKLAAAVREEAVHTFIRAMQGDPTLAEEIISRIKNPEDLKNIQKHVVVQRSKTDGLESPLGAMDNPLAKITPEVYKGYGWKGKEKQMEESLVQLATYRGGMIIQRQSPHRPYSKTSKDAKSRRIDLVLQSADQLQVINIYEFKPDYIDEVDVTDAFLLKGYPAIAFRDFGDKGQIEIIAHLVAPAGITEAGVERLMEIQTIFDDKYSGKIRLNALTLDELVWGEMYPALEKRYATSGDRKFLNNTILPACQELCNRKLLLNQGSSNFKRLPASNSTQLTIYDIKPDQQRLTH